MATTPPLVMLLLTLMRGGRDKSQDNLIQRQMCELSQVTLHGQMNSLPQIQNITNFLLCFASLFQTTLSGMFFGGIHFQGETPRRLRGWENVIQSSAGH